MFNHKFRWITMCLCLGIVTVITWFVITSSQPSEASFVIPVEDVYRVAFQPHSNTLAMATAQGLVFWQPQAQPPPGMAQQVSGTMPQPGPITLAVWSPDGRFLATMDMVQYDLVVWDTTNPNHKVILPPAASGYYNQNTAFSPDGSLLAAGTSDGMELWYWRDQRLLQRVIGSSYAGVAWSADGQYLAFSGRLWRVDPTRGTLTEERNLDRLGSDTMSGAKRVAAHPTQPLLAVADTHGGITLLHMDTNQIQWSVHTPHMSITSLVFSPDGRFVASGGGYQEETEGIDPAIRLWRVADGQLVQTFPAHALDTVEMITISEDGRWIAALTHEGNSLFGGLHRQVRVWPMP